MMTETPADLTGETVAVLLALAGARTGDPVAQFGAGDRVQRALLAMSGTATPAASEVRVAIAGHAGCIPECLAILTPGGRLVALAEGEAQARASAHEHGLQVQAMSLVPGGVAWSTRTSLD